LPAACLLLLAGAGLSPALASVETLSRFLEYDQTQRLLVYEISLRNLGSLPVRRVLLESEPSAREGALKINELVKEKPFTGRLSFELPEGLQIFQPRLILSYSNHEGERIREAQDRPTLIPSTEFLACDLDSGWVEMRLSLTNPNPDPVIFLELRSENPPLDPPGTLELGDIQQGCTLSCDLRFRIDPGQRFFNPTLHISYHAYLAESTRLHRNFYTLLLPDLGRLESALEAQKKAAASGS
jgi:hypothetical protein